MVLETTSQGEAQESITNLIISSTALVEDYSQGLGTQNLRIVISLEGESSYALDYTSQRYNEYLTSTFPSVGIYQYNNFLKKEVNRKGEYLNSSSPFSGFSTNMPVRDFIIQERVSKYGTGDSVAKGIIIYDVPIEEVISERNTSSVTLETIKIELPEAKNPMDQMSVYIFCYDAELARTLKDNVADNFTLTTGMSLVASYSPIGQKTTFANTSTENPLVGMEEEKVESDPDSSLLIRTGRTTAEKVKSEYSKITEIIAERFISYDRDKNYQIDKILNKENYFSDLWLTRDTKDNHKFVFAFDVQSFLGRNGLFPFVYRNPQLASILIAGGNSISPEQLSSIISVDMYREFVKEDSFISTNNLGTVGRGKRRESGEAYPRSKVGTLSKVDITLPSDEENYKACFYEGYDNFGDLNSENNQVVGEFKYSVDCTVIDNSPEMMRNLVNVFYRYRNSLILIHDHIVNDSSLVDIKTGKLKNSLDSVSIFIDGEQVNVSERILDIVNNYDIFLSALGIEEESINLTSYFNSQLQASSGKPQVKIFKEIENLISIGIRFVFGRLEKYFPKDPMGSVANNEVNFFNQNTSRSIRSNLLTARHTFLETYSKGKKSGYGVDYIFTEDDKEDKINSIAISGYDTRRIQEFRKYFKSNNTEGEIIPEGSYENSSYAYMSAKTIRTPGRNTIDQTTAATSQKAVVEYDYDRYGQLYVDLVTLRHKVDDLGARYPSLMEKSSDQNINNKIYSSIRDILGSKFGVSINEVVIPQFSSPQIIKDGTRSTIYNLRDRENCGPNAGLPLLQSVIGGENTQDTTTQSYLDSAGTKIKDEDTERSKGTIDSEAQKQDRKERAIKLPFAILGELTLDKEIHNISTTEKDLFNSLTGLRKILTISETDVENLSGFDNIPNQFKSMIIFSTTNKASLLGSSDGSQGFDATRPRIRDANNDTSVGDLVSFFNDQENIPPYPQTEDPMKTYARFLTFWMNYRQIAVVEYLDGFNSLVQKVDPEAPLENGNLFLSTEMSSRKLKLPSWQKLNSSVIDIVASRNRHILCRVRTMSAVDFIDSIDEAALSSEQKKRLLEYFQPKEVLNLPTYNQYFYIHNDSNELESIETLQEDFLL